MYFPGESITIIYFFLKFPIIKSNLSHLESTNVAEKLLEKLQVSMYALL
jgi:hypothetical protein